MEKKAHEKFTDMTASRKKRIKTLEFFLCVFRHKKVLLSRSLEIQKTSIDRQSKVGSEGERKKNVKCLFCRINNKSKWNQLLEKNVARSFTSNKTAHLTRRYKYTHRHTCCHKSLKLSASHFIKRGGEFWNRSSFSCRLEGKNLWGPNRLERSESNFENAFESRPGDEKGWQFNKSYEKLFSILPSDMRRCSRFTCENWKRLTEGAFHFHLTEAFTNDVTLSSSS